MDKAEYKVKLEEINSLAEAGDFRGAAAVMDTIEWKHIKSVRTLCMVGEIYEAVRRYDDSKRILTYAYNRSSASKSVLYRLTEINIRMGNYDEAELYFAEFEKVAPNDSSRYILKYKLLRARNASVAEQIEVLRAYKEHEYTERWAYELARLYKKNGQDKECVAECDDMILWFADGKYVMKAMELKMQIQPLTDSQQKKYNSQFKKAETTYAAQTGSFAGTGSQSRDALLENLTGAQRTSAADAISRLEAAADATVSGARRESTEPNVTPGVRSSFRNENSQAIQSQLASSIRAVFSGLRPQGTPAEDVPKSPLFDMSEEAAARTFATREELSDEVAIEEVDLASADIPALESDDMVEGTGTVITEPVREDASLVEAERVIAETELTEDMARAAAREMAEVQADIGSEVVRLAGEMKTEAEQTAAAENEAAAEAASELSAGVTAVAAAAEETAAESAEEAVAATTEDAAEAAEKVAETVEETAAATAEEEAEAVEKVAETVEETAVAATVEDTVEAVEETAAATVEKAAEAAEKAAAESVEEAAATVEAVAEEKAEEAAEAVAREAATAAPVEPEKAAEEEPFDLEALFAETGSIFAKDVASGQFRKMDTVLDGEPETDISSEAEALAEEIAETEEAAAAVEEAAAPVEEATEEAAEGAKETAEEAAEAVEETVEEAVEAEEAVAEEAVETAEETAVEAVEAVEETAEETAEAAEAAVEEAAETVEETVEEAVVAVEETAEETAEAAEGSVEAAVEEVEKAVAEAAGAAEEAAEETTEAAEGSVEVAVEEVAEAAEEAAEAVEETAAETTEVVEATEESAEAVETAVEEVTETAAAVSAEAESAAEDAEAAVEEAASKAIVGETDESLGLTREFHFAREMVYGTEAAQEDAEAAEAETPETASEENMEEAETLEESTAAEEAETEAAPEEAVVLGGTKEFPLQEVREAREAAAAEIAEAAAGAETVGTAGAVAAEAVETAEAVATEAAETAEEASAKAAETVEAGAAKTEETAEAAATKTEESAPAAKPEKPARLPYVPVEPRAFTETEAGLFSYLAGIPGIREQVTSAVADVHNNAGDKTSKSGNILVMGRSGNGKSRMTDGLILAICADLGIKTAKVAKINADEFNRKDVASAVKTMSGGFLVIERASRLATKTMATLSQAMEFRTDALTVILEDDKYELIDTLSRNPGFAEKFTSRVVIPVFTNDELVTFAKVYTEENGCHIDEMGTLALYTIIGENQKEGEPITVGFVKDLVDQAMAKAKKRRFRKAKDSQGRILIREKDFPY